VPTPRRDEFRTGEDWNKAVIDHGTAAARWFGRMTAIGGGSGPAFDGASAVQTGMTSGWKGATVLLEKFLIRRGSSGGATAPSPAGA